MQQEHVNQELKDGGRGASWALLIAGVVLLMVGLMSSAGSMDAKQLSGQNAPNVMDFLFTPVILYLIPALMISRGLSRLRSRIHLPIWGAALVALFGFTVTGTGEAMKAYNHFIRLDTNITESLNNVENAYRKRFNVITNMDAAARGYREHERATIKDVVEARAAVAGARAGGDKVSALGKFDTTVRSLFVNIEQYPDLKTDKLVFQLMKSINDTEQDLVREKTEYNSRVVDYNRTIRLMPNALLARVYGFAEKPLIQQEPDTDVYDARKLLKS